MKSRLVLALAVAVAGVVAVSACDKNRGATANPVEQSQLEGGAWVWQSSQGDGAAPAMALRVLRFRNGQVSIRQSGVAGESARFDCPTGYRWEGNSIVTTASFAPRCMWPSLTILVTRLSATSLTLSAERASHTFLKRTEAEALTAAIAPVAPAPAPAPVAPPPAPADPNASDF